MAPAALRCHRKRGGESPPPSYSSSLTSSLDGRRVSPLVLGLHGVGGARAPPRLDLSLSVSVFHILPFHHFLYSRRSVTLIGLKFEHDFYPDISFLAAKEGLQPPYGVATRVQGAPDPLGAPLPRGPIRHRIALILLPKNHIYSKNKSPSVFIPFGLCLIWIFGEPKNMQQIGTGIGHLINMLVPKIV